MARRCAKSQNHEQASYCSNRPGLESIHKKYQIRAVKVCWPGAHNRLRLVVMRLVLVCVFFQKKKKSVRRQEGEGGGNLDSKDCMTLI